MRNLNSASVALLVLACCGQQAPRLPANAERLAAPDSPSPALHGDEFKIVHRGRPGRDDTIVVAIQLRPLTREQLRSVALRLVGTAKTPTVDFYSSESVYEACVRDQFGVIRQQTDPADQKACSDGTIFRVGFNEPRVLYWGRAAPR